MHYLPLLALLLFLAASYWWAYTPLLVSAVYLLLGVLTFLLYAKDKRAARAGDWRVSESTLHFLSLLGGWPGAVVGQQTLRHKTRKTSFRVVFWFTVLINSAALAWLHTNEGSIVLNTYVFNGESLIKSQLNSGNFRQGLLFLLSFR